MKVDIKRIFTFQKGRKALKQFLQAQVALIVVCVVAITPMTVIVMQFMKKDALLTQGVEAITLLAIGAKKTALLRKKERIRLEQYAAADRAYVEKYLEGFEPLKNEIGQLNSLLTHDSLKQCRTISDRLKFLREANRLKFSVEAEHVTKEIAECELTSLSPIEVGGQDINRLLSRVEGVKIGGITPPALRPEIVMKEFHLKRVKDERDSEHFEIDMKLIKREGIEK
ncbi:MAG: hypothetical protein P0S94_00575 [Simkaniaceae bacterium]|nr:hypothetical protein [Simkaniaceae bacterium]